jgi:dihydrolipoamide dehydrogenase
MRWTDAAAEEGGTAPAPQVYDLVLQAVGQPMLAT